MRIKTKIFDSNAVLRATEQNFSRHIYISSIEKKTAKNKIFLFGVEHTELISDEKTGKSTLRTIKVPDIFEVNATMTRSGFVVKYPPRKQVANSFALQWGVITARSENMLLRYVHDKLVNVPEVQVAMSPFHKLMNRLKRDGVVRISDFKNRKDRNIKYIGVLVDLNFARKENDEIYRPGIILEKRPWSEMKPNKLYQSVISKLLRERQDYLRQVLHLTMLGSYLKWTNSYYLPAYESQNRIHLSRQTLISQFSNLYHKTPSMDTANAQIDRLVQVEAVNEDQFGIIGESRVWGEYSKSPDMFAV